MFKSSNSTTCESAWKHITATVKTTTSGDITSYKTCCIASSPYFKSTSTHNHEQTGTWKTCCWMFAEWRLHRRTFCQTDHLSTCWQTICQGIICWWTLGQMDTIIMANEYHFLHFYRHIHVYLYVLWQIYIWKHENIPMEKTPNTERNSAETLLMKRRITSTRVMMHRCFWKRNSHDENLTQTMSVAEETIL